MVPVSLSSASLALAPALKNHLWQSTLFALVAALLALALRSNRARERYWLWMAASLKFLLPFALLAGIGSHFARPRAAATAQPAVYFAVEDIAEPFSLQPAPAAPVAAPADPLDWPALLPALCGAVWLAGFATVLAVWCVRWRRVAQSMRAATPLADGREMQRLRQIEREAGLRNRIELRVSQQAMEPGVFGLGLARPVLAWPAGISQRLDDAQLDAILAHEVCHVRRRDNLTAALHMLVEAVFWFHPLVWWLGARLLEERERACDQEVLRRCNRPEAYAEGILKVCEFCLESPLPCVSGVTGSDLKKRIVNILAGRMALKLGTGRKLLLLAAALLTVAVPILLGQAKAAQLAAQATAGHAPAAQTAPVPDWETAAGGHQEFDVVSIHEDKNPNDPSSINVPYGPDPAFYPTGGVFSAKNWSVAGLITFAYKSNADQGIALNASLPDWAVSRGIDIEARTDNQNVTKDQMRLMVQSMLADRFKLKVHYESREVSVYAVELAKPGVLGPGLRPHPVSDACSPIAPNPALADPNDPPPPPPHSLTVAGGFPARCGSFVRMPPSAPYLRHEGARNLPMNMIVSTFSGMGNLGRPVIDRTGLTGNFDWVMEFIDERRGMNPPADADGVTFEEALKKQLGLKLVSQKAPVDFLVVDHIEQPSPN